jgi:hypothetical protein
LELLLHRPTKPAKAHGGLSHGIPQLFQLGTKNPKMGFTKQQQQQQQ